jgi:glycosyltransferase involved in cell wall biosynthesis
MRDRGEPKQDKAGVGALKILLSAYACEPGKGSEPGIGWHWAVEIARLGHEVHILTRANNVAEIERGLARLSGLTHSVHGYDLPRWARWWKKGQRGAHLYYALWQWGAYKQARRLHKEVRFDLVHHITFGVFRHPSFMGRLGIPFVFGPVGGGECAPPSLLRSLPLRARISEALRSFANRLALVDPLLRSTLRRAMLICSNTPETQEQIPKIFRAKTTCVHDVAVDQDALAQAPAPFAGPHFLFAGRLIYWKGIHLALRALAQVRTRLPAARLTLVGTGRDRAWLENLAQYLGLENAVDWRGWLSREEVLESYAAHTAFVFPSLHDSGGMVVTEAMAQGLPVICLDLGGPGAILPAECGVKIPARGRAEADVVADLAAAMIGLATDETLHGRLAANALAAARRMTWSALVAGAYAQIELRLAPR